MVLRQSPASLSVVLKPMDLCEEAVSAELSVVLKRTALSARLKHIPKALVYGAETLSP